MDKDINLAENYPLVRGIKKAYQAGQKDEALDPMVMVDPSGRPPGRLGKGDYVIFYNIRGEREVELTESLINRDFTHFPVKKDLHLNFVTMLDYNSSDNARVAFPSEGKIKNTFAEVLSEAGIRLL